MKKFFTNKNTWYLVGFVGIIALSWFIREYKHTFPECIIFCN